MFLDKQAARNNIVISYLSPQKLEFYTILHWVAKKIRDTSNNELVHV